MRMDNRSSQTCCHLNTRTLLPAKQAWYFNSNNWIVLQFINILQFTHILFFYLHNDPMKYFFYNLYPKNEQIWNAIYIFCTDYNDNNRRKIHPKYPPQEKNIWHLLSIPLPFFHIYATFYWIGIIMWIKRYISVFHRTDFCLILFYQIDLLKNI